MATESSAILVTRPRQAGEQFASFLQQNGYVSELVPMLDIVDLPEQQVDKTPILDLDAFTAVIFISMNAVRCGMEWIDRYWPQFPVGVDCYAIGKATAESLASWQVPVRFAEGAMNSESLLALPGLQSSRIAGKKVLLVKGLGGREHLAESLIERGASVVDFCCYRREPAMPAELLQETLSKHNSWILTATSGESLKYLQSHLHPEQLQWPLVVPGQRVGELAGTLGFTRIYLSENAGMPAMLEAIRQAANTQE